MKTKEQQIDISPNDLNGFRHREILKDNRKRFPDSFQIPCRIWKTIRSLPEFTTRRSKRGRPAFADEKLKLRAIMWNYYSGESMEATARSFGLSERMLTFQIEKWKLNGFFHKLTLLDYNFIFGRNGIKDWNWMVKLDDHFSKDSRPHENGRKIIAASTTEYKLPNGFKNWDDVFIQSLKAIGIDNASFLIEEYLDQIPIEVPLPTTHLI